MTSGTSNGHLQADDIKRQAAGQWIQILQSVCRLTAEQLNPKIHQACPQCGGTDRFRALDDVADTGGLYCNQCFSKGNGDGFSAIQWLNGCTLPGALKRVSEFLGNHSSQANGHHKTKPEEPAKPKKVHATSDKAAEAFAYGLTQSGILPRKRKPDAGWRYRHANGTDAFSVVRWNLPDGTKTFGQITKVDGGWICGGMPEPRPLYRLPDVIDAPEVWITEGEKSCDAAVLLGLNATTSGGGSGAAEKSDWQPLDGKRVYILPDADEPGTKYAREVLDLIRRQAPNATVEIKHLRDDWPTIPSGGDIYDWQEQFDTADAETLQARLNALPDRCGEYVTPDNESSQDDAGTTTDAKLIFHDAWEAAFKPRPMRECIIEGLLRRGEVGNVIASTKTGKSWFGLMLLISVATGRDWLGRRVARGNVLLIDNELHEETIENRVSAVRDRMNIRHDTPRDRFEYLACRGDWVSLQDLIQEIPKKYPPGSLNLIVIDAKYRLFGNGLEENSNDDQTTFHNMIDKLAKEMNCPIVLIHHATKGDQSGKAVTDVGSGGGSQSRAVDLHMTIRPHQQPGLAVLDAAVRSFAPVESVTLRWNWPIWSVDFNTEPVLPKNSKDADRVAEMRARILKHLSKEWQSVSSLADRCSTQKGRPPFVNIVDDLEKEKLIERCDDFVPKNTKRTTSGIRFSSDKTTSDTVGGSLSEVSG